MIEYKPFHLLTEEEKNSTINEFMETSGVNYYLDWNYIMPVVYKVQTRGYIITIVAGTCKVERQIIGAKLGMWEAWQEIPENLHISVTDCCFMAIDYNKKYCKV